MGVNYIKLKWGIWIKPCNVVLRAVSEVLGLIFSFSWFTLHQHVLCVVPKLKSNMAVSRAASTKTREHFAFSRELLKERLLFGFQRLASVRGSLKIESIQCFFKAESFSALDVYRLNICKKLHRRMREVHVSNLDRHKTNKRMFYKLQACFHAHFL